MILIHFAIDDETLLKFWSRFSHQPSHWKDLEAPTFRDFATILRDSVVVFEMDFGYIRVESVIRGITAIVHGAFWSPAVMHKLDVLEKLIHLLGKMYNLECLDIPIPVGSRSLKFLLKKLGFKFETYCTQVGPNTNSAGEIWRRYLKGG